MQTFAIQQYSVIPASWFPETTSAATPVSAGVAVTSAAASVDHSVSSPMPVGFAAPASSPLFSVVPTSPAVVASGSTGPVGGVALTGAGVPPNSLLATLFAAAAAGPPLLCGCRVIGVSLVYRVMSYRTFSVVQFTARRLRSHRSVCLTCLPSLVLPVESQSRD